MTGQRLSFGRLVRADLRHNSASFAGVAVAIFVASALVTGLGVLVESGIRGGLAPERYTAVDVVVGSPQYVDVPEDLPLTLPERAPLPADAARDIAEIPGVESVVADVTVPLVAVPPTAGASAGAAATDGSTASELVEAHPWAATALTGFALREGREPASADEVVVTAGTGGAVGDLLTLAHGGDPAPYRVVGIVDADAHAAASERATHVFLSQARIAELDPHGGTPQVLGVFTAPGQAESAAAAIREALPEVVAQTGDGRGDIEFLDSGAARATLIAIGSAFVGTCILVAMFIVAGTLSLSVQSRRRDYALLRAVGASPKQVHALVAREVLSIAVIAALLGIAPGYLLSTALQSAFVSGGVIPGDFALALGPLPAIGAVALVLSAAWGAARIAARRPAKLDPIEALRESSTGPAGIGLPRIITGIVFATAGISVSTVPLVVRGEYAAGASAGAAMMLIVALALLGPWLVALSVRLLGAVLRRMSAAGFLAAANASANSRRLAAAILPIALGIGLGLVQIGAPAIIANEAAVQAQAGVTAELRVTAPGGLSADAADRIAAIDGVSDVSGIALSSAIIDSRDFEGKLLRGEHVLQGVDPASVEGTLDLQVQEGSLAALDGGGSGDGARGATVAVSTDAVQTLGLELGDQVTGMFGDGAPLEATVVAIYERGLGFGDLTMDLEIVRAHTTAALDAFALVSVDDGALDQVREAVAAAGLQASEARGQKAAGADAQSQQGWVNLVALIVILGYIAIAVINTLVMATGERSRELALLQLIGSSRRQVRAMMRVEAMMVAAIAVVFGVVVAIPPLIGMSIGISGQPMPALPVLPSLLIIGSMGALALLSLWAATGAAMRTRPIEEIGSRQ
ncbi:ABC transporter permease [Microbacterium hydrocarbonoxydans]|uniref:Putative ABC transport system permease protein n=1 Tax=Microbacterium hydrocarbonoxydans TaxID=273678 RepID=A0A1H4ITG6_9MICO|nr:FtsX-like permease family protein [Microbacterium hydrocarbonoxydans]SEB36512.1 putative ABC transport system permease protein [Microbacterium hydrocarbonoxydans]